MRNKAPLTPRARRPVRLMLGRKKGLTPKTYHRDCPWQAARSSGRVLLSERGCGAETSRSGLATNGSSEYSLHFFNWKCCGWFPTHPRAGQIDSRQKFRQSGGVDFTNSSDVWASVLWGGIGGGYLLYGWRQKESVPLVGGVVMSLACFLPALSMTLLSLTAMVAVYWLMKRGY